MKKQFYKKNEAIMTDKGITYNDYKKELISIGYNHTIGNNCHIFELNEITIIFYVLNRRCFYYVGDTFTELSKESLNKITRKNIND